MCSIRLKKKWNVINNIYNKIRNKTKAVIKSAYENNPDIVRIFNEHILTVGRRVDDFLESNHYTTSIPKDYLQNLSTQSSIFFRRSNIFEINKIILSLKRKPV